MIFFKMSFEQILLFLNGCLLSEDFETNVEYKEYEGPQNAKDTHDVCCVSVSECFVESTSYDGSNDLPTGEESTV